MKIANWCVTRFEHEDESEDNKATVPHFREVAARCEPKIPTEVTLRNERVQEEANKEFDEVFGNNEELKRMNELFEEAFSGFEDPDEPE